MQSIDRKRVHHNPWPPGAVLAFVFLLSTLQISTAQDSPDLDEEQCIFDQEEQKQVYLELEKQYEGSEYVEEQYALLIPWEGELVTLKRGGCVHFGVSIELQTIKTDQFEDAAVFFSKILELVTEFDQGLIDREKLAQSIRDENWHENRLDRDVYYSIAYPDVSAFEIFRKHDQDNTTIGISFYYS